MNNSHNTRLDKMLSMVHQKLGTRETADGCKQGMKFDVSIEYSYQPLYINVFTPVLFSDSQDYGFVHDLYFNPGVEIKCNPAS